MKRKTFIFLLAACLAWNHESRLNAQENQKIILKDSLDGAIDLSYFISSIYGFLPILVPVTEPALGYGVVGGPVFIHGIPEDLKKEDRSPQSMTMAMGMVTGKGSWALGGGHVGYWKQDHIRYLGAIYYASLNLEYYPPLLPRSFGFNLEIVGTVQQIAFRLGEIKLFAGLRYIFSSSKVTFELPIEIPGVGPWEFKNRLGGLGPVLFLDYRDNTFTPNRGVYVKGDYAHYAPWLGGDVSFNLTSIYMLHYAHPFPWLVTGLRAEAQTSWGDPPFFMKPYVNLRGIPAMRYLNDHALTMETEERFDLTGRWSLTAFGGLAKAFNTSNDFSEFEWVYNYGAGFRYKIARLYDLYSGIDFAWGPGSWGFYLIFGHAWNRN
ncbi:MAG: hypothetical protein ACWGNV_17570 [Bacteroidales bacterium]